MSNSIKPEDLQKVVQQYLIEYTDDIEKEVIEVTDELSGQALTELKQKSPRREGTRKNPYYKGWSRKKEAKKRRYVMKLYNKTNPSLTHLLEKRTHN